MTSIPHCIRVLEAYIQRGGAQLFRTPLPESVHGRIYDARITLRTGLSPTQELVALIHELVHWLVHRDARCGIDCTLYEYEAEAVETLVMKHLDLPHAAVDPSAFDTGDPTDNLLFASVNRVTWATAQICGALAIRPELQISEAQPPIDLEAATRKEIVLEYEEHRMRNFFWLTEAL